MWKGSLRRAFKTEILHLRVSPEQRKAIEAAAAKEHRTVSGWIMALILEALAAAEDEGSLPGPAGKHHS